MQKQIRVILYSSFLILSLSSCGLNPQNADVDVNVTLPEAKSTVYANAIRKLGTMSAIYQNKELRIMSKDIADNTGTSTSTGGEIPRNITEMVKSTLNGIGGGILFVPYDPVFMQQNAETGYTDYADKLVPNVVVSGGITEFDRGLVTKGDSADASVEVGDYGFEISDKNKGSLAQVTLDFNLLDFEKNIALPHIQAINAINLHKSVKEDSFGFTIKGVSFGAKGNIKKIQGRHAAVRLLVQISMIQLIGRYQQLPYWRLVPGAEKDEVVLDAVKLKFHRMTESERIAEVQKFLYLHNYSVNINGQMDSLTSSALQQFSSKNNLSGNQINEAMYLALFESIPIDKTTQVRRENIGNQSPILADSSFSNYSAPVTKTRSVAIEKGDLSVSTNQSNFKIGDKLKISFSVKKPMFIRLVMINSKGEVSTLFPNPYQSDNYVTPGKTYTIPPRQAEFTLDIEGPAGTDKIRAVGSQNQISSDSLVFTKSGEFDNSKMSNLPIQASTNIVIN